MGGKIMKLKKIFVMSLLGLFLFVGCSNTTNTPSKKVEDFLAKYQNQDQDILTQLELTLDSDTEMDDDQKEDYKALMTKQYQNLTYKITDEQVEDDSASVDVEIEVYDYATSITKSKEYFDQHKDEFVSDDDDDATVSKAYIDYKIKEMKDVTDKTTYQITFNLTKTDGEWTVDDITDADRQKLHGLY
jgi:hypothetical protein